MIIRKLQKKDFQQYTSLINKFRSIGLNITQNKFNEIYDQIFKTNIIYVVEIQNTIIATSTLIIEQKFIHKLSKYARIEDVFVDNQYRGKKIGQLLIKHIIDYCKDNNFYKITLTCNEKLISFYKKNNFEVYQYHMSQLL